MGLYIFPLMQYGSKLKESGDVFDFKLDPELKIMEYISSPSYFISMQKHVVILLLYMEHIF